MKRIRVGNRNRIVTTLLIDWLWLVTGCGDDSEVVAGPQDVSAEDGAVDPLDITDPVDTGPVDAAVPDTADVKQLCTSAADCPGAYCEVSTGACVPCLLAEHCAAGEVCLAKQCAAPTVCEGDKVCLPIGGVCQPGAKICVDCNENADCDAGFVCRLNSCLPKPPECASSKDCAAGGQVCDKSLGYCVDCTVDGDCPAERHCKAGLCVKDICLKGETKCQSPMSLELCNDAGSGWVPQPCKPDVEACQDGACLPVICKPGEKVCEGDLVKLCDARGVGLSTAATCTSTETCQGGTCLPRVCTPGEPKCSSKGVETCADDGIGWDSAPCGGAETCVEQSGSATCEPHVGPVTRRGGGQAFADSDLAVDGHKP